jgi:hypothetical protein
VQKVLFCTERLEIENKNLRLAGSPPVIAPAAYSWVARASCWFVLWRAFVHKGLCPELSILLSYRMICSMSAISRLVERTLHQENGEPRSAENPRGICKMARIPRGKLDSTSADLGFGEESAEVLIPRGTSTSTYPECIMSSRNPHCCGIHADLVFPLILAAFGSKVHCAQLVTQCTHALRYN